LMDLVFTRRPCCPRVHQIFGWEIYAKKLGCRLNLALEMSVETLSPRDICRSTRKSESEGDGLSSQSGYDRSDTTFETRKCYVCCSLDGAGGSVGRVRGRDGWTCQNASATVGPGPDRPGYSRWQAYELGAHESVRLPASRLTCLPSHRLHVRGTART